MAMAAGLLSCVSPRAPKRAFSAARETNPPEVIRSGPFATALDGYCPRLAPDGAGGVYAVGGSDAMGMLARLDSRGAVRWTLPIRDAFDLSLAEPCNDRVGVFGTTINRLAIGTASYWPRAAMFAAVVSGDGVAKWVQVFEFERVYKTTLDRMVITSPGSALIAGRHTGPITASGRTLEGEGGFVGRFGVGGALEWLMPLGVDVGDGIGLDGCDGMRAYVAYRERRDDRSCLRVRALDAVGDTVWERELTCASLSGIKVRCAPGRHVWIGLQLFEPADFGGGILDVGISSRGKPGIAFAQFDSMGNHIWSFVVRDDDAHWLPAIARGANGALLVPAASHGELGRVRFDGEPQPVVRNLVLGETRRGRGFDRIQHVASFVDGEWVWLSSGPEPLFATFLREARPGDVKFPPGVKGTSRLRVCETWRVR